MVLLQVHALVLAQLNPSVADLHREINAHIKQNGMDRYFAGRTKMKNQQREKSRHPRNAIPADTTKNKHGRERRNAENSVLECNSSLLYFVLYVVLVCSIMTPPQ